MIFAASSVGPKKSTDHARVDRQCLFFGGTPKNSFGFHVVVTNQRTVFQKSQAVSRLGTMSA